MSDDTREAYRRARLGGSLEPGTSPAVLVVDFSRGFTDPECPLGADLTPEVEATKRLLDAARERSLPIIFTTIGFEPNLKDGSLWLQKAASAFFGTNFPSILISQRVDTVLLCGATTSGCIRATAVDLLQYGYPTLVPRECVGDRAQAPHEANLVDIQAKYADVVPLESVLAYVSGLTPAGVQP